jgi:DNA polymerase III delta subunit
VANYLEFRRMHARGEIKRAYWVCGPVHRLVEEVVDTVRRQVAPSDVDDVRLVADEVRDAEIWNELNQYPYGDRRLVTVRSADAIRTWQPFVDWLDSRMMPRSHVLFVSSAPNADTSEGHMKRIVKSGRFVRCGPFRNVEHAYEVLMAHGDIDHSRARFLYERVGGDMDAALECLAKCAYFDGHLTERILTLLTQPRTMVDFVDALVAGRKRDAMTAAQVTADEDIPRVIGLLDARLDTLLKIHRAMKTSVRLMEVSKAVRMEPFVVKTLLPSARAYDPNRVRRSSQALAFIDGQHAEGVRDALLETLVVIW